MDFGKLEKLIEAGSYKKDANKTFAYGTAGFRTKAADLETVLFRMGILAVLRSKFKDGKHIGMMITASHNPVCDNGVKLVDPAAEMLAQDWETHATQLANVCDAELLSSVKALIAHTGLQEAVQGRVVVGRDTRPSSDTLQRAAVCGVEAVGGVVVECGVVTTPVLHYRVLTANDGGRYGEPSNSGYTNKLITAFLQLQAKAPPASSNYCPRLLFDGANGVGGPQILLMADRLAPALQLELHNCAGEGVLNLHCGADHVKSQQTWPTGVPSSPLARCASVDGDADRVVYSYIGAEGRFHLMDGDKIATLVAGYLRGLLVETGLTLDLGLVQTAYANGASTHHITHTLGIPVTCAKTGVKHLHHAALGYDIGVYFEANGHGTVIFSERAKAAINTKADQGDAAATQLRCVMNVINETVGDAISDMLLVETVLRAQGLGMQEWDSQYLDLPNRLVKVRVADRSLLSTTDSERRLTSPPALQPALDALLATQYPDCQARAFIRPSGTEDVVRVYAEANTVDLVEKLATEVCMLAFDLAGGVGERPQGGGPPRPSL